MKFDFKTLDYTAIAAPFISVILALLVGSLFILLAGSNPWEAYRVLFTESFGSMDAFALTLQRATPLVFTGLAVAFAFRCGLFNIGAEGQLYMGGLAAVWVGLTFTTLPSYIHIPFAILAAAVLGGLWAAIPGILKAKLGVHEVINTIMLNFIAFYLTDFFVIGPLHGGRAGPETARIVESARLTRLMPPSRVTTALYIALIAAVVVYIILFRTKLGYEIRAVGLNAAAAQYGGINVAKNIVLAMMISGGLAGLAGAEQILGLHTRFIQRFSPDLGFMGIAVALLGRSHPFGVILAAILFGALNAGGAAMDRLTDVPRELIVIIQALIIFFVAADQLVRRFLKRRRAA